MKISLIKADFTRRYMKKFLISFLFLSSLVFTGITKAQMPSMRIALRNGDVYVYHVDLPLPGQGFNIYRKGAGTDSLVKLNKKPIISAAYPQEFRQELGDLYPQIQDQLQTTNPTATMFRLRTDRTVGLMYTFVYPQVARALGRLFIDSTAVIGQKAHYKIEFVNDLGQPTGKTIEEDVLLKPSKMLSPTDLKAINKEENVTLTWHYPKSGYSNDDKIIRFNVYRRVGSGKTLEKINGNQIIIRENNLTTFKYNFVSSSVGRKVEYLVTAVSITGEESKPGNPLEYFIKNNLPPQVVSAVQSVSYEGDALVTWTPNTDWDLMGYNIYRSKSITKGFKKINNKLIRGLQASFIDSTVIVGNAYYYKVTAVDSANNESSKSTAAVVYIKDSIPPPPATSLHASFSDSGYVRLSWMNPAESPDFKTWMLLQQQYTDSSDFVFNRIDNGNLRSQHYDDPGDAGKGFVAGAFYRFGVAAIDSSGNVSDTVYAVYQIPDHTPPAPPSYLTATNHDGVRVALVWNASSSPDTKSYRIYRQTVPGVMNKVPLRIVGNNQSSIRDETMKKGLHYRYAIIAVDSVGNESRPTYSDTVWVRDEQPPRQVLHVSIDTVGSQVRISWGPVVAYDMAGYRVYKSRIQTGIFHSVTDTLIHKPELLLPRSSVKGYWFRVRAVDTSGNESKPSKPVALKSAMASF